MKQYTFEAVAVDAAGRHAAVQGTTTDVERYEDAHHQVMQNLLQESRRGGLLCPFTIQDVVLRLVR